MMTQLELKRLVVFSILMQNGQGIKGKAPNYIDWKYSFLMGCEDERWMRGILDTVNQAIYDQWVETWLTERR